VAVIGIIINTATALLFMAGRKSDLNIRGAFLHMAADAGVSAGVVIAGVAILLTGWQRLDPIVSLIIAAVILISTWGLLRESVNLALDAVPEGIDPQAVETFLKGLPGVKEVHDLHIWGMSTTENAMTAHLVMPAGGGDDRFLHNLSTDLRERFGIAHITVQVEQGDEAACEQTCQPDAA
jgi:cobalt-zinc-cadmium efflux system protein